MWLSIISIFATQPSIKVSGVRFSGKTNTER